MPVVADQAGAFKNALVTAVSTAINDSTVKVCYGHPGVEQPDDIVCVTRITSLQEPETLGTNRSRVNMLTADIVFSVYRAGGSEQEKVAGDRAYALLSLVEEYFRVTDTTLSGLVYWCFCTSHISDGSTDPEILAKGRLIEVNATFTARARISS